MNCQRQLERRHVGDSMGKKKAENTENFENSREATKRKKGHMALRNNVYDLKLELWHVLKPLEYYLLDVIIDKTIKWRVSEAKITIQELMERTRQAETHIYAALRSLKQKKIIIWNKQKYFSVFGLNEEYFGGLLIKKYEEAQQQRRSKMRVVVDNSKNRVDSCDEIRQSERRISSVIVTNDVSNSDESRQSEQGQDRNIIEENASLNTLLKDISLNTSLKSGETEKSAQAIDLRLGGKEEGKTRTIEEEDAIAAAEAKVKINKIMERTMRGMPI